MAISTSDAGSVVFAIPMVICLLISFFRLDEMIGRPKDQSVPRRRLTSWDENGQPQCEDPRPGEHGVYRQRY